MIEGLKPYADYKEAGLYWLATVPKHWDMVPNRALMQCRQQVVGSHASNFTLLSLTLRGVIARDMVNPKGKFPAQFNAYQVVKPNDLVFCLFDIDETPRAVGLSSIGGMITGAYDIFSPTNLVNSRFLYYYYLFVDEGKLMKPLYRGLRKTIQRGVFASLKTPLPPPDEQAAIVRFLDHANRKIGRVIRAKRNLIRLLYEQKQAIIHSAVTRGSDADVAFKPSVTPWLVEAPSNWTWMPIKRLLSRMDYGTSQKSTANGSIRILTMGNIQNGEVVVPRSGGVDYLPHTLLLEHHDLLFTRTNGNPNLVGKVGIFRGEVSDRISFASYLVRLRVKQLYDPEWLHLVLNSASFWPFARSHALVNLQTNLNSTRYGQFAVPVPPLVDQKEIVKLVRKESKPLITAITRTEREIALMQEYHTRLTADIVTGKLDVREAAARLTDLPANIADESLADEAFEQEIENEAVV